ncbi:MAG: FMN-binding protein [Candidatus Paceibacterota bacterium]|jgi:uncharacterized protein with FMN-binding domain
MSPFQKNLQRILVYLFSAISIIIIILGIGRAKKSNQISTAPDQPIATDLGTSTDGTLGGTQVAGTTTTTASAKEVAFSGSPYKTQWGNAVASIKVTNGKITSVTMPTVPNSPPSVYAEPYLIAQALASGSANIQGVSGATVTSLAFKASLESAIAKANAEATTQGQTVITANPSASVSGGSSTQAPAVPRRFRHDDDDDDEFDD